MLSLCLLLPGLNLAGDVGENLLEPEKAFKLTSQLTASNTLIVRWKIAEGYYIYRNKIAFKSETPGYYIDQVNLPEGKIKHDEFFGDVEIYRNEVRVELPVSREPGAEPTLKLKAISRGCADIGVCYPPLTQLISFTFPAEVATTPTKSNPLSSLTDLLGNLGGGTNEFLEPDQAFKLNVDIKDSHTLVARWSIVEGYYLYRDKIAFALEDNDSIKLGPVSLANGKVKHDEFFGEVEIYDQSLEVNLPIERANEAESRITLETSYQGCANAGICYPPISKTVNLVLPPSGTTGQRNSKVVSNNATSEVNSAANTLSSPPLSDSESFKSEQDRIAETLVSGTTWLTVITFFGFGLMLALTPCVFPMIPILSGIIVGQGKSLTASKAFSLSLIYVLAMAITYTVAGVLVGLSGENVQAWFQNPWILSSFAIIFGLLALSMFGFYELQMPNAIQSRLTQISNHQRGGTLIGVAIMGFLSALIIGPCVTAPLIGALIYIADTGDAILGGLALFALSLGMGTPLLIIGASAGKLLPKAGPWMDTIKAVFGVLLLGVGIWLLERILPMQAIMVATSALLIISAIYMGAVDTPKQGGSGWFRLWKGVGLIMLLYGVVLLVGAAAGSKSMLQPLKGLVASTIPSTQTGLKFERIKGMEGLNAALARARQQKKPLMLDLYADWCNSCKEFEAYTFTDSQVQAALSDVILVQSDVTHNDESDRGLLKTLGVFGPPAILFYAWDGREQRAYRVVGFMPADKFRKHIERVLRGDATL